MTNQNKKQIQVNRICEFERKKYQSFLEDIVRGVSESQNEKDILLSVSSTILDVLRETLSNGALEILETLNPNNPNSLALLSSITKFSERAAKTIIEMYSGSIDESANKFFKQYLRFFSCYCAHTLNRTSKFVA